MIAVTKQKAVPSIEFSTAKGNVAREQEVEDSHLQKDQKNEMHLPQLRQLRVTLHMQLSKNNLIIIIFPQSMWVEILWPKIQRVRKI